MSFKNLTQRHTKDLQKTHNKRTAKRHIKSNITAVPQQYNSSTMTIQQQYDNNTTTIQQQSTELRINHYYELGLFHHPNSKATTN